MKSLTIVISRPGDPDNVNLSGDTKYMFRFENYPEITFSIDCKQLVVFENFKKLRYMDGDPASSDESISFFETLMSNIFKKLKYLDNYKSDKEPIHIRLITTPMELAQLPFEFVPSPWDSTNDVIKPLLTDPDRVITLTREELLETEASYTWPKQPRILFAWAEPGNTVPHNDHKNALVNILKPLAKPKKDIPDPEPDTDVFLTELPNASLKIIKEEIKKAIEEKRPYSHIHILAHGGHSTDFSGVVFRLLLCDNADPAVAAKVEGKDLIDAIIPDKKGTIPIVVTLSACDSANTGNVLVSSGSLVDQLHRAGIPCVFASQFPLTQPGSIDLVTSLYENLVNAIDPREALHRARVKLKDNGTHDWASLVAYARFPGNINEQLQAMRLKMLFNSMKTTGAWVDHLLKYSDSITEGKKELLFQQITKRQEESIARLSEYLTADKESKLETDALRSEHLGILGSAYKRQAEFFYHLIRFSPLEKEEYIEQSIKALNLAKDFYYGGHIANKEDHWVSMQYLALKFVMGESSEDDQQLWQFIQYGTKAKEKEEEKAEAKKKISDSIDKLWAWGTLIELYLIKPFTVKAELLGSEIKKSLAEAIKYAGQMKRSGNTEVIDSTARQLDRYISWWPELFQNAFMNELKEMATQIRNELLKKE